MPDPRLSARAVTTALAATGLLLTGGAGSAIAQGDGATTLRLTTKNITVTTVDLGPPGKSPGDLYVYDGTVHKAGKRIGRIYGANTSIKVEGQRETVSGQLSFRLGHGHGHGHEIIVGGVSAYPSDRNDGFIIGEPFTRAIIGGTGRYAGARGTVTTTRQPNGNYKQVFRLLP